MGVIDKYFEPLEPEQCAWKRPMQNTIAADYESGQSPEIDKFRAIDRRPSSQQRF